MQLFYSLLFSAFWKDIIMCISCTNLFIFMVETFDNKSKNGKGKSTIT